MVNKNKITFSPFFFASTIKYKYTSTSQSKHTCSINICHTVLAERVNLEISH